MRGTGGINRTDDKTLSPEEQRNTGVSHRAGEILPGRPQFNRFLRTL